MFINFIVSLYLLFYLFDLIYITGLVRHSRAFGHSCFSNSTVSDSSNVPNLTCILPCGNLCGFLIAYVICRDLHFIILFSSVYYI